MDGEHRGALPHTAGQTGETLQVHRDVRCDAENRSGPPHSKLLLLGHRHGRKLHRQMGKPHHVLCGQCVCCCHRIKKKKQKHAHTHTHTNDHQLEQRAHLVPADSRGPQSATYGNLSAYRRMKTS